MFNIIKQFALIASLLSVLVLSSCSEEASSSGSSTGSYSSSDGKFVAEVTDSQIEIFITGDDTKSLYWSGTWASGETVTSKADVEKLQASLMGSQNETKTFEVSDGEIKFEFSIMGTTSDVVLEK